MNDNESDEDYHEGEDPLSDGESVSGSKADANGSESESESNEKKCAFDCSYGDIKKISGRYVAVVMEEVGLEVTIKEHEKICGCDLNDPDTPHFLKDVDDDTDSGVEELDAGNDDSEDEAMVGEEVDHIDEGFEDGDEDD